MNIAIIDADLIYKKVHNFPNLACMKISGYHKGRKDKVTLLLDYNDLDKYDLVYISKVFTDTKLPEEVLSLSNVKYGGTGFFYDNAEPLSYEIEHYMPDYHLYDEWVAKMIKEGKKKSKFIYYTDYSIGFTTRGCIRKCPFCVNQKYDKVIPNSPVEEFFDPSRKHICLLDDNILAYKDYKEVFEKLMKTKKSFQFKQGLDIRLLTKEKAEALSGLKYKDGYYFAFDNIADKKTIKEKLKLWRSICKKRTKFYVLCGYYCNDLDDIISTLERIKILMEYNCYPFVMKHNNYLNSKYKDMYILIARWTNAPQMFDKKTLKEYTECQGERSKSMKTYNKFVKKYPNIEKEYFNIKINEIKNTYKN